MANIKGKNILQTGKSYTAYNIPSSTTEETSTTATSTSNSIANTTTDSTATSSSTSIGQVAGCQRFSGSSEGETLSIGEIRGRYRRVVWRLIYLFILTD